MFVDLFLQEVGISIYLNQPRFSVSKFTLNGLSIVTEY